MHTMVWHKEPFLPSHENGAPVPTIIHRQIGLLQIVLHLTERRKALPVHHIFSFGGAPPLREEAVSTTDDLRVEIGRELRPIVGQTTNAKIPAEE